MIIKRVISFKTIGYSGDCSVRYLEGLAEFSDQNIVTVYTSIENGNGYDRWTLTKPIVEVLPEEVEF